VLIEYVDIHMSVTVSYLVLVCTKPLCCANVKYLRNNWNMDKCVTLTC